MGLSLGAGTEDETNWVFDCGDGSVMNNAPFGYGTVFTNQGLKVYEGFVFEGKRVCFGQDFYPTTQTPSYCGCFMNDKRHGWGKAMNEDGSVSYENEWTFDEYIQPSIPIPDGCEDGGIIHNYLYELVIGNNCYNSIPEFRVRDFPNLTKIEIGSNSFKNTAICEISKCDSLDTIRFGRDSFNNALDCEGSARDCYLIISNNEKLRGVLFETYAFGDFGGNMELASSIVCSC